MKIKLIVTLNKELISLSFVNPGEITIGRDAMNTIAPLTADGLSRRHARLFVEGDKVFVEDCGSTNGSYKMGEKIEGRQELKVHDLLQFGKLEISVEGIEVGSALSVESEASMTARTAKTLVLPRPIPPIKPIGISPVAPKEEPKEEKSAALEPVEMEPVAELSPVEEVKAVPEEAKAPAAPSPLSPVEKPTLKPGLKLPPHKPMIGAGVKLPPKKPVLGAGLKLPPRPTLKVPLKKPIAPAK